MVLSSSGPDAASEYAVELIGISKTFPGGVEANKQITLRIRRGEVHGLLGENGAGKTTLMNILYGLLTKDAGRIIINGEEVELTSPQDAIVRGVGMVHQHFKLIPPLTVVENVMLGLEPCEVPLGRDPFSGLLRSVMPIAYASAEKRIRTIAKENGLQIDPKSRVVNLSVGLQQRVEIIKTLYRAAEIVILDEPTSVLTPQEVDELFATLKTFRETGKTIILITHKLREPMILCDRISVLRDGELVGTVDREDTSPEQLAKMMVGRSVVFNVEKAAKEPGDVILSVANLRVEDNRHLIAVNDVSLAVRAGEILGIAGVVGNGQTELVEAIVGLRKPKSGKIIVKGQDITGLSPRLIRKAGVSHVPEDRQKRGLVLPFTVQENLVMGRHQEPPFATGVGHQLLDLEQMSKAAAILVDHYSIKAGYLGSQTKTLSGGNQQKLVVARELGSRPKLLVAAQPTRGLDVGATEHIHEVLISMRDAGIGVLLVSAELDEILNLSDRIAVMFNGRIVAMEKPEETTPEQLGLLMAGHVNGINN